MTNNEIIKKHEISFHNFIFNKEKITEKERRKKNKKC